jgi:DNA-binding transcriptional MerR regulator
MEKALPSIPAKRYFTIGEVSELCGVKPYVLRYWEQEFTQLKPMKRRGNRRYYQHHEVLLIRRIRDLLYEQGFTISGARNQLTEGAAASREAASGATPNNGNNVASEASEAVDLDEMIQELEIEDAAAVQAAQTIPQPEVTAITLSLPQMRQELISIRGLLVV